MFIETSAKTGENVEEVFVKCAKTILNKIESGNPFLGQFLTRRRYSTRGDGIWNSNWKLFKNKRW